MGFHSSGNHIDWKDLVGFFLTCIPILTYFVIVKKQYRMLKRSTARVQILSTRTALFLPSYAICVYASLVVPEIAAAVEVPTAIAEGTFKLLFVLKV